MNGKSQSLLSHKQNLFFSVVIPARNEAAVIERTLQALSTGRDGDGPEVIVVCNGCHDQTAERARLAYPSARVIELETGSKSLAINAGIELARFRPVIIVDADVIIEHHSLAALADVLRGPEVMAASPSAQIDLSGCDRWVRSYYKVWQQHSYLKEGVGGSGVYGLSADAVERLGRIPPVIADDTFTRSMFPVSRQRRVCQDVDGRPVFSIVKAPRRLGNLVACEVRWRAGDVQLRDLLGANVPAKMFASTAKLLLLGPSSASSVGIYYLVKVIGRATFAFNRIRRQSGRWHRDESRRAQ